MSRINQLINESCPNGVPFRFMWEITSWDKRFNEVENFKQETVKKYRYLLASDLKKLSVKTGGNVRLLSTGNDDQGWTTEDLAADFLAEGEVVTIPWGGRASVQYFKGLFVTTDNRIAQVKDKSLLETKFLYYFMLHNLDLLSSFYRGSGIQHPSMAKVLEMRVPVPPIEVQREIIFILDKFRELEAELEAELVARKQQFSAIAKESLTQMKEHQWSTLGEISLKVSTGATPLTTREDYYESGSIPWLRTQELQFNEISETQEFITEVALKETSAKWIPKDCVIIAISGATAGRSATNKIPLTTNQHCCNLEINPELAIHKYVFYYVQSQYNEIRALGRGPRGDLNTQIIRDLKIPLPSLEDQQKIVLLLDSVSALSNSEREGLPAEINARHKQFEYYLYNLLTFNDLEVA